MEYFTVSKMNQFLHNDVKLNTDQISSNRLNQPTSNSLEKTRNEFVSTLNQAIENVNELQLKADKASKELATGKTDNVADVMIAAEKADIALRLMVQVRNKIIDAYQEVMKMQV